MAELYQHWASLGSSFHYVSASPWQMFEALHRWRKDDEFPMGTVHLRNFRLRDQLLKKVILHRKGKRSAIQKLIRNLPRRQYILVGDSGEKDPEIYRKIARKFPSNIVGLFIRELPDHPIAPDRWQKICEDVPGSICERFTGAKDLKNAMLWEANERDHEFIGIVPLPLPTGRTVRSHWLKSLSGPHPWLPLLSIHRTNVPASGLPAFRASFGPIG